MNQSLQLALCVWLASLCWATMFVRAADHAGTDVPQVVPNAQPESEDSLRIIPTGWQLGIPPLPEGGPDTDDGSIGDIDIDPYAGLGEEPLPPLAEELWLHGGSYLYEPEGDRLNWPDECCPQHYDLLRLPESWCKPKPWTAFQEFVGNDPIHPWSGLQWFGEDGFQWEPRFVAYGSYEQIGIAYQQGGQRQDGIGHQMFVELDLRLTGTERFHVQFRPLGKKNTGGSILRLDDPVEYVDNSTAIPERYWFEGEFYSIFGGVIADPFKPRDYHFVVGKFPFVLHNALLINDDILGFVINKNTIIIPPLSNMNLQVFCALDDVDATDTAYGEVAGVNITADWRHVFFEATYAYERSSEIPDRDAQYAALSVTKFIGPLTLAGRSLFRWGDSAGIGEGQLYVLESNLTRSFPESFACATGIDYGVFYANLFKATSGWTPISGGNFDRLRSTFAVDPLVAISTGQDPANTEGVAAGVQLFRHHEDESIIPEVAYENLNGSPVWGVGLQYLKKLGPRTFVNVLGIRTWSSNASLERDGVFVSTFVIF